MLFHSNIYVDDRRQVFKSGLISFWLVSFVQISLNLVASSVKWAKQ